MGGIDYNLRLAEHGRLAGELLVVGGYSANQAAGRDMHAKKIAVHAYVGNAKTTTALDVQALAKNANQPVPRRFKSSYPDRDGRIIPLNFFFIESCKKFPYGFAKTDIAEIKGDEIACQYTFNTRGKMPALNAFEINKSRLDALSLIFIEYEQAYVSGTIHLGMMRHIERRMSLPLYWLRTRRIEKKRRHLENVAFKGEKGNAKAMKKELDEIIEELNRKAHPIQSP